LATSSRLPDRLQAARVFAIIVLMLYGWMMWWFLFRFTTWRLYLDLWELAGVLAFSLTTALLESALVFCLPAALALILPRPWFRDAFVSRGGMLAAASLLYMMFLDDRLKHEMVFPQIPTSPWLLALPLAAIPLLVVAAGRIPWLRRAVESMADRATVFLYVFMPLSAVSLALLCVRWVIGAWRL